MSQVDATAGVATFVENASGFRGDARVYRLDPPFEGNETVVVSAITSAFDTGRAETMVFPYADGSVTDWGELAFSPDLDHEAALRDLGYGVAS